MDELLEMFMKNPEKEFYVREIARKAKKSPTTISKYLHNFKKKGILVSEKKFNHLIYRANVEERLFSNLKLSRNLRKIIESGVLEFLNNEFNHPEAIGLFGSFVRGENIDRSDIDMFVISPVKTEPILKKYEKKLGYKIQLFVFSRKDIEKMKTENPDLLNNLVNGLVLEGHWELFK